MLGVDIETVDELTSFADLIKVGTGRLSSTKDAMAERNRRALAELRPVIVAREQVDRACERVATVAEASADLDHARRSVAAAVESAPRRHLRAVRRARKSIGAARDTIDHAQRVAAECVGRVERQAVDAAMLYQGLA